MLDDQDFIVLFGDCGGEQNRESRRRRIKMRKKTPKIRQISLQHRRTVGIGERPTPDEHFRRAGK